MELSFTKHSVQRLSQVLHQPAQPSHFSGMKTYNIYVCLACSASAQLTVAVISLVWLFSRQIPLALLPFSVYSIFHVATYTRTNLIPTFQPPKAAPAGQSPGAAKPQSGLAAAIGKFVKEYYDGSMMLVAGLEIALWGRLLLSALTFSKGAFTLLLLYTVFLRARFHQSTFVQGAFGQFSARVDQQVNQQNIPPVAKQVWDTVKNVLRQAVEVTDVRKYLGGAPQQADPKKSR